MDNFSQILPFLIATGLIILVFVFIYRNVQGGKIIDIAEYQDYGNENLTGSPLPKEITRKISSKEIIFFERLPYIPLFPNLIIYIVLAILFILILVFLPPSAISSNPVTEKIATYGGMIIVFLLIIAVTIIRLDIIIKPPVLKIQYFPFITATVNISDIVGAVIYQYTLREFGKSGYTWNPATGKRGFTVMNDNKTGVLILTRAGTKYEKGLFFSSTQPDKIIRALQWLNSAIITK